MIHYFRIVRLRIIIIVDTSRLVGRVIEFFFSFSFSFLSSSSRIVFLYFFNILCFPFPFVCLSVMLYCQSDRCANKCRSPVCRCIETAHKRNTDEKTYSISMSYLICGQTVQICMLLLLHYKAVNQFPKKQLQIIHNYESEVILVEHFFSVNLSFYFLVRPKANSGLSQSIKCHPQIS